MSTRRSVRLREKTTSTPKIASGLQSIVLNSESAIGSGKASPHDISYNLSTDSNGRIVLTPVIGGVPTPVKPKKINFDDVYTSSDDHDASETSSEEIKQQLEYLKKKLQKKKRRKYYEKLKEERELRKNSATSLPAVKRGRGRPRKYPLAESSSATSNAQRRVTFPRSELDIDDHVDRDNNGVSDSVQGSPQAYYVPSSCPPAIEVPVPAPTTPTNFTCEPSSENIPSTSCGSGRIRQEQSSGLMSDVEMVLSEMHGINFDTWPDSGASQNLTPTIPLPQDSEIITSNVLNSEESPFKEPCSKKTKWKAKFRRNEAQPPDLFDEECMEVVCDVTPVNNATYTRNSETEQINDSLQCELINNRSQIDATQQPASVIPTCNDSPSIDRTPQKNTGLKQKLIDSYLDTFFVKRSCVKSVQSNTTLNRHISPRSSQDLFETNRSSQNSTNQDLFPTDPVSDLEIHQLEEHGSLVGGNSKTSDHGYSSGSQRSALVGDSPRRELGTAACCSTNAKDNEPNIDARNVIEDNVKVPPNIRAISDSDSEDLFVVKKLAIPSQSSKDGPPKADQKSRDSTHMPRKKFRKRASPKSKQGSRGAESSSDDDYSDSISIKSVRSVCLLPERNNHSAQPITTEKNTVLESDILNDVSSQMSVITPNQPCVACHNDSTISKLDISRSNLEAIVKNNQGDSTLDQCGPMDNPTRKTVNNLFKKIVAAKSGKVVENTDSSDSELTARSSSVKQNESGNNLLPTIESSCVQENTPNIATVDLSSESETEMDRARRLIAERNAAKKESSNTEINSGATSDQRNANTADSSSSEWESENSDKQVIPEPITVKSNAPLQGSLKKAPTSSSDLESDSDLDHTNRLTKEKNDSARSPNSKVQSVSQSLGDSSSNESVIETELDRVNRLISERNSAKKSHPSKNQVDNNAVESVRNSLDDDSDSEFSEEGDVSTRELPLNHKSDEKDVEYLTSKEPPIPNGESSSDDCTDDDDIFQTKSESTVETSSKPKGEHSDDKVPAIVQAVATRSKSCTDDSSSDDEIQYLQPTVIPENSTTKSVRKLSSSDDAADSDEYEFGSNNVATCPVSSQSSSAFMEFNKEEILSDFKDDESELWVTLPDDIYTFSQRAETNEKNAKKAPEVLETPRTLTRRRRSSLAVVADDNVTPSTPTLRKRSEKTPVKETQPATPIKTPRRGRKSLAVALEELTEVQDEDNEDNDVASTTKASKKAVKHDKIASKSEDFNESEIDDTIKKDQEDGSEVSTKGKKKRDSKKEDSVIVASPKTKKSKKKQVVASQDEEEIRENSESHITDEDLQDQELEKTRKGKLKAKGESLESLRIEEDSPGKDENLQDEGEEKPIGGKSKAKGKSLEIPQNNENLQGEELEKTKRGKSKAEGESPRTFKDLQDREEKEPREGKSKVKRQSLGSPRIDEGVLDEEQDSSKRRKSKSKGKDLESPQKDEDLQVQEHEKAKSVKSKSKRKSLPSPRTGEDLHHDQENPKKSKSKVLKDVDVDENDISIESRHGLKTLTLELERLPDDLATTTDVPRDYLTGKKRKRKAEAVDGEIVPKKKLKKAKSDKIIVENSEGEMKSQKRNNTSLVVLSDLSVDVEPLPAHFLKDLAEVKPHSQIHTLHLDASSDGSQSQSNPRKKKKWASSAGYIPLKTSTQTKFGAVSLGAIPVGREALAANFKSEKLFGKHIRRATTQKMLTIRKKKAAYKLAS